MKKNKKLIAALTTGVMAASLAVPAYAAVDVASTDLTLVINDQTITTNEEIGQPFITSDGHTMIPLRLVSETLGYKTSWAPGGTIHIGNGDRIVDVTLTVGADNYFANGIPGTFETSPVLINDRTYLPARDFMELYGVVDWDNDTRTVTITMGEQPEEETSDWTFKKGFGGDIETVNHVYVQAINEKTGKVVYLTGLDKGGNWPSSPSWYEEYVVEGSKVINGQHTILFGRAGVMGGAEYGLYLTPDLDTVENTAELTYVRNINYSTDYTIANGYLYYTEGVNGPYVGSPNELHFFKIGDGIRDYVTFDLDFEVARCKLNVEDGVLVATEKDGTRHEILNVPEADSVDVKHMKEVLESGETLEGFLESDFLTFDEIACMPGASVGEEGAEA